MAGSIIDSMPFEIERKFLVDDPPSLDGVRSMDMEAYYISSDPAIRVRIQGGHPVLAVKNGSGLSRIETPDVPLTQEQFERLKAKAEGRPVRKTRYYVPYGDHTYELDVYYDHLEGLLTVEVEFGSEDEARAFVPPEWFGREVTGIAAYTNASLALHGLPGGPEADDAVDPRHCSDRLDFRPA